MRRDMLCVKLGKFDQCVFQSMSYVKATNSQSQPGCLLMNFGKSDKVHEITFLLR